MDQLFNYITEPATIINFIVFVFGLGMTYANLNNRIKELEKKAEEIDVTKIESKLAEIQTDLQRIKTELNRRKK